MEQKRTPAQIDADVEWVAANAVRGLTTREMAAELAKIRPYRLSHVQISKDLLKAKELWRQSAICIIDEMKARELAGLEQQEREAWAEWTRSKGNRQVKRERRSSPTGRGSRSAAGSKEVTEETEGQCGDPAYQRLILDIREARAKLLGLNAPIRNEITGKDGEPLAQPFNQEGYDLEHLVRFCVELGKEAGGTGSGGDGSTPAAL